MKKIFFAAPIVLAVMLFSTCASFRSTREEVQIYGLLSRIEHGENTVYIFGSAHLGKAHWYPLPPAVNNAMERADVFAFEMDLSQQSSPEFTALVARYASLPDGQTLRDYLPPDVYTHFVNMLRTYDAVNYEMVKTFTPMAISSAVNVLEIYPHFRLSQNFGIDPYVLNFAQKNGKPVQGLNTIESEFSLVVDLPYDVQVAIARSFQNKRTAIREFRDTELIEAYEKQNMDAILQIIRLATEDQSDPYVRYFTEVSLIERSVIFADEIERLLRETESPTVFFVTMGIGHLVGDDDGNVFHVLRNRGFDIEPLH